MINNRSLSRTIRKELLSPKLLYIALPIAAGYSLVTLYLFNYRLLIQTWAGNYPLQYKISLTGVLLQGFQTLFSAFDLSLLLITSVLVGLNFMLAFSSIQKIKQQGSLTLSIGGASIIGIAASGCSACGLSLFSIFGASAALTFLPLHGLILHILAVILLLASMTYMIRKLHQEVYCRIKTENAQ